MIRLLLQRQIKVMLLYLQLQMMELTQTLILLPAGNVTLTGTQTLTNKTLTSPKVGTSILDTNGNELALVTDNKF